MARKTAQVSNEMFIVRPYRESGQTVNLIFGMKLIGFFDKKILAKDCRSIQRTGIVVLGAV